MDTKDQVAGCTKRRLYMNVHIGRIEKIHTVTYRWKVEDEEERKTRVLGPGSLIS